MANSQIAIVLSAQFDRVWKTFRNAISDLDEEQFSSGDIECFLPRNLAYHILETADFYSSDCETDAFDWGYFKADNKPQMLCYADKMEAIIKQWLLRHSDEQLLEQQSICKWTGETVLDRVLYSLRHTQHHTAQINSELRRRGLAEGEWE